MKKGLKLLLCVDWEGLSLEESNLRSLREFRKRWAIPFLHFMNPAYFTSTELFSAATRMDWDSWVEDPEFWGLHLHGARHFVEACGLPFQQSLTFARSGDQNSRTFQGHEVMLHSYSAGEFSSMLETSLSLFEQWALPCPQIFRAGGWMSHPDFLPVLRKFGFAFESSATSPQVLDGSCWQGEPLQKYLSLLWGDLNTQAQPYWDQGVLQIPNNLGAIDYWETIPRKAMTWARQLALQENSLAVVTLHQETAEREIGKLDYWLNVLTSEMAIEPVVSLDRLQKSWFSPYCPSPESLSIEGF